MKKSGKERIDFIRKVLLVAIVAVFLFNTGVFFYTYGGGFTGLSVSDTVTNAYFNDHDGNPSDCVGKDTGTTSCTPVPDDETWFYDSSNGPMDGNWDFAAVWLENIGNYPTLR